MAVALKRYTMELGRNDGGISICDCLFGTISEK